MTRDNQEPRRPLYEEVDLVGEQVQWDSDRELRLKRFEEIVGKIIGRGSVDRTESETQFLDHLTSELRGMISAPFSRLSVWQSPISVDLSMTEDGESFEWMKYGPAEVLAHDEGTLRVANVVLNALTPELGLDIHDSFDTAKEKALSFQDRHLADVDSWRASFSTVIPGVYVTYSRLREQPKKAVGIDVQAIKEQVFPT